VDLACPDGTVGSVAVRAAWLWCLSSLGSRPRLLWLPFLPRLMS